MRVETATGKSYLINWYSRGSIANTLGISVKNTTMINAMLAFGDPTETSTLKFYTPNGTQDDVEETIEGTWKIQTVNAEINGSVYVNLAAV